ncbi:OmpA family protein [Pedobacter sp. PWIIR3]
MNLQKDFSYTQLKQTDKEGDLSQLRKTLISGQVGMGYDIPVSGPSSTTKFVISPFASYHPYFGQDVRSIESWSVSTLRVGIALKLGKGKKAIVVEAPAIPPIPVVDVTFTVRAPKAKLVSHHVSETLPLLNYVFFDQGSALIPSRYMMLSKEQARDFSETQLQNLATSDMTGRSVRQMNVYYNILNIVGDRMRKDADIKIVLSGASRNNPEEGKTFANAIKNYITGMYGIDGARIATNGRSKPINPSEQPGGKKELELLREGDRRVDIQSGSKALMLEVGGGMMNPVQINTVQSDPMDSRILFNVPEATQLLTSYTIDLSDQNGAVKHLGPFHANQESVTGASVLGNNQFADYKVVMTGTTKAGGMIKKESTLHLQAQPEIVETGSRYSILFNFNKATTVATYEKFLTDVVVPLIAEGSTVLIHGHTDVIGAEPYNAKLSVERAKEAQQIIESALAKAGKTNVKIQTIGFGESLDHAPFNNGLPEERFYNRTVIIDISNQ